MTALYRHTACAFILLLLCITAKPALAETDLGVFPRYDVSLRIDPGARTLAGEGTLYLPVRARGNGGTMTMALDPAFVVTDFTVNGTPAPIRRLGARWSVRLNGAGPDTLTFRYRGKLPERSAADAEQAAASMAPLMAGPWGAVLDESGNWYPRLPATRALYRIDVETPAPFRAVTTGRSTDEAEKDGLWRAHFATKGPVGGLSLFVGRWQTAEVKVGDVVIRTWFDPDLGGLSDTYLTATARHIAHYTKTIGPYPYGAFHVVSAPFPVGLGYPGMTYIGERVLALPFVPEGSLRHEVLHSWWGNAAGVDYRRGNWAEGLTTYMADYARARERGPDIARDMRLDWLRDFAALPTERDQAPIAFTAKTHDAGQVIGYGKVAFFFHMLKRDLGTKTFQGALRRFWSEAQFRTASWADLQAAFESESGVSLDTVFTQWLTQGGAPGLELWQARVRPAPEGFETIFTLAQNVPTGDAVPYDLNVPVVIDTETGETHHQVRLDTKRQTFTLATQTRPRRLTIDPGYDLFRRLDPNETPPIFRDVSLNGDTLVIILTDDADQDAAARALATALMDTPPRIYTGHTRPPVTPLLIIGTERKLTSYLLHLGVLADPPPDLPMDSPVRAWVSRGRSGQAIMSVLVRDEAALRQAAQRLVHYGRKGYVWLDEKGTSGSGVLPLFESSLTRTLVTHQE